MSTNQERVANTALSGSELKGLMLEDAATLAANEGLLSDYIAYGRVGYRITFEFFVDNPHQPRSKSSITSRLKASSEIAENPALAALEAPPLVNPSADSAIGGISISRNISSPNAERLRVGLPIPVMTKDLDGTSQIKMVTYPPLKPEDTMEDVVIDDVTAAAMEEWKPNRA